MKTVLHAFAFVFIPAAVTALGAGLALWAWMNGQPLTPALLLAVILLAAAQVLFFAGSLLRPSGHSRRRMADFMRMFAGLKSETAALARRLENLERKKTARAPHPATGAAAVKTASIETARKGADKPASPARPRPAAARTRAAHPAKAAAGGASLKDPMNDFRLYMEPVADLKSRATAFYRAAPALALADGRIFLGAHAGLRAAQLGIAARFDMENLRRSADFIRLLRGKGRDTFAVCPLTRASLASRRFRDELTAFMKKAGKDISGRIVLDISHPALSSLSEDGTFGLAWLAQNGVRLCLSGCQPDRIDPEALGKLGFAFLDMDVRTITSALRDHGGDMLRRAAAPGLAIIASGVDAPELEARVRPFVRLARGRVFSPPRRVRSRPPAGRKAARRDAA